MKKIFSAKYISFYLSVIILLVLVLLYFNDNSFQAFIDKTFTIMMSKDEEKTRNYFQQFGIWGPLFIIFFTIFQMFLLFFPSWIPIIISVLAYGFWWGVLLSLTAIFIASTIGYFIGRKIKGAFFEKVLGEDKVEKMRFWIDNYAFGSVVLFRVSPFLSNDSISFIAGMFQMGYKKFMAATMAGMIPVSIAIGYFSEDISTLEEGMYWVGGIGTLAYAVYIFIDYRKRKNKS